MNRIIYLIGPRAAGKTSFSKELARRLGWDCVDTDARLEATAGKSIGEIVAGEGWDGFRHRESMTLQAVTADHTVIATGGGMVLAGANRRFMREHGIVLYLCAPASVLAARLEARPNTAQRPSLTGKSITEEVADVLLIRDPLYRETATGVLDATLPPDRLMEQALAVLNPFLKF